MLTYYRGNTNADTTKKLDLNVGAMYLKDQFEWPLFSTQTYLPEDFARSVSVFLAIFLTV